MLQNYFKIAFRNLWRNKVTSGINLAGLALGIAVFVLLLEYISFERSVNQFHTQLPHLYRVLMQGKEGGTFAATPPGLAPLTKQNFSEVKGYCRVAEGIGSGIVSFEDKTQRQPLRSFREAAVALVDGSFFDLFSFPLVAGTASSLSQPNTVALSASCAQKYFGTKPALGRVLTLHNQFGKTSYTVTAVYEDMPEASDLRYDLLFSLQTLANPANLNNNDWAALDNLDSDFTPTYFQLQEGAEPLLLEQKLNDLKNKLKPDASDVSIRLQPMANMHLAASLSDPYLTSGNLKVVYLLGGIALLILVIAWFNYINLATAGAIKRAKEVGVRKVIGANRGQLMGQFLGESALLNGAGFGLALLLIMALQPIFNKAVGKNLSLALFGQSHFWLAGLILLLIGSLASGGYTAFALTTYQPLQTLRGTVSKGGKSGRLRQSLVVFQFSISLLLICATLVMYRQLQYMQNRDLGMKLDQLLVIKGPDVGKDETFGQRIAAFQQQVSQLAYVKSYTNSGNVPGSYYNFGADAITKPNPRPGDEKKTYSMLFIDERYLPTYDIKLAAGSNLTTGMCEQGWDKGDKLLINEKAARQLGYESAQQAVGQKVKWGKDFEIVGVVKDYHHQSLKQAIDPMIFLPRTYSGYLTLRLNTAQMQPQMAELERLYKQSYPGNPFDYFFVDESYNKQYQSEKQYSTLFTLASGLAIFIACLGLFGLAAFTAEQRTKEVGVRKVLGASVGSIVALLSRDFIKLVLIAILIAVPIAWYAADRWLQDFAYRTNLSGWIFALAGGIAILIALITVSFQSIRAALMNPVESLRSD